MEQLKAKLKKQGGFTMVELLIVVAIIAILVAVSIPMMNSALEKTRHAVDQANVRDAIALASMKYLTDGKDSYGTYPYVVDENTHQGSLGTKGGTNGEIPKCECGNVTDGLTVTIEAPASNSEVPNITTNWVNDGKGGATTPTPTAP